MIEKKLYVGDGYWVTKEGKRIALIDMDEGHLANSLAMVERMMPQAKANLERLQQSRIALQVEAKRRRDASYKLRIKKAPKAKPAPHVEATDRKFRNE